MTDRDGESEPATWSDVLTSLADLIKELILLPVTIVIVLVGTFLAPMPDWGRQRPGKKKR